MRTRMILLASIAFVMGCGGAPNEHPPAPRPIDGKMKITATTGIIADTARAVGGDHVEVTGLMGPGVDPHLYKASQGDLAKLSGADLVLYNGLHLEGRMADTLVNMARQVETVQVTASIPESELREPPEFDGHFDPHVWFDVRLWKHVVTAIEEAFARRDPAHAQDYGKNAAAYRAELDALDAYAREQIATIAPEARILVTAHDAFGYFGDAYGIEVLGLQGISTASEYGLQDVERLVNLIVERKIPAVFVESSISPRSIEALITGARAKGHAVKLGGELFSDALGAEGTAEGTYLGMLRHNIDTIVSALK